MADLSATSTSLRPSSLDAYLKSNSSRESHHTYSKLYGRYTREEEEQDNDDRSDIEFDDEDDLVDVTPVVTRTKYNSGARMSTADYSFDDSFNDDDSHIDDTNDTIDEYAEFNDPILSIISSDDISPESLAVVLRTLPLSDKPLVKYINKAFKVLQDLNNLISMITTGWEFIALEKDIQRAIRPDFNAQNTPKKKKKNKKTRENKHKKHNSKSLFSSPIDLLAGMEIDGEEEEEEEENGYGHSKIFDTHVAKTVLNKALEFHQSLYELNAIILDINRVLSNFSPLQYVSDAGVLLTNISLKIIELKNQLSEKINVSYSQSKLIIMGSDLEELLQDFNMDNADGNDAASSIIDADHPIISNDLAATIEGYKDFVITILNQLHDAQETEIPDEINECLAVIGDLEKMFDALMKQVYEPEYKASFANTTTADDDDDDSSIGMESDDLFEHIPRTEHATHTRQNSKNSPFGDHTSTPNDSRRQPQPASVRSDFSSPANSSNFDNDTLYESDQDLHNISNNARKLKSQVMNSNYKTHSREPSTLSSSATLGMMSRSTSNNNFRHNINNAQGRTTLTEEMPFLLQAFDNAKEAELELKSHMSNKKAHKALNTSPTTTDLKKSSPPRETNEENELNEDQYFNQYDHPSMIASINLPQRGLGFAGGESSTSSIANNLYTGSAFIKRPVLFKTTNPINASNPLVIKEDIPEPLVSPDTPSLASSIFGSWFKPTGSEPSPSSAMSQSLPTLPSNPARPALPAPVPTQFKQHNSISTSSLLMRQGSSPQVPQEIAGPLELTIEDDID